MKEFEFKGKAMGTDFAIAIVSNDETSANKIAYDVIQKIYDYENIFSRFQDESELSKLNRQKKMIVSEIFLEVTTEARKLFALTDGYYNPLLQISRIGYDKDFPTIDSYNIENTPGSSEKYNIDFTSTITDLQNSEIILQEGQKLDFGGFLKGYLAEKLCKEILSNENVRGAIVNIGGDIHARGLDENGKKFVFNIYNPVLDNSEIEVELFNQSLATSGTYKRTWEFNGVPTHHILGREGKKNPDSDIISASVVHDSGGHAEAFAKMLISIGPEEASKILITDKLKFIIIKKDGAVINKTK